MDEKQTLQKGKAISDEDIAFLMGLDPKNIDLTFLKEIFAFSADSDPLFNPRDTFTLKKGKLYNVSDLKTTVGRYIFNLFLLDTEGLGGLLGYINYPLNKGKIQDLDNKIAKACTIEKKLPIQTYFDYIDKMTWIGFGCNFFMSSSMTNELIETPDKVKKRREELFLEYETEIKNADATAVNKIEKELLDIAKEELKDCPDYEIYESGCKGDFNNNYKVNSVMRGTTKNLGTGESEVMLSNLMDGSTPAEMHMTGDILVQAPYSRVNGTAILRN